MTTLIRDSEPVELARLRERRRRLGLDRRDEMWEGVLHMNPPPAYGHQELAQQLALLLDAPARAAGLRAAVQEVGSGTAEDYRVPDGALLRPPVDGSTVLHKTVALAIEIVSPDDETWAKLPFYAAHGVEELLIVDPQERQVHWLSLQDGEYLAIRRSALIKLGADELSGRIEWL